MGDGRFAPTEESDLDGKTLYIVMDEANHENRRDDRIQDLLDAHGLSDGDDQSESFITDPIQLLKRWATKKSTTMGRKLTKKKFAQAVQDIEDLIDGEIDEEEICDEALQAIEKAEENAQGGGASASSGVGAREVKFVECTLSPILSPVDGPAGRDTGYISAPSGAGKSTVCAKMADHWQFSNPHVQDKVYIFSRVKSDRVLDALEPKPRRIIINNDFPDIIADPESNEAIIKQLEGGLVIFDDIDTITPKKLAESVQRFRDDLLETGRHHDITVLSTSHHASNWKSTRTCLNEASFIIIFPQGTMYGTNRLLKEYCGLDKEQIKKILTALRSRWALIHIKYPRYVLYEHGAYML
jgi:hypothetical protein